MTCAWKNTCMHLMQSNHWNIVEACPFTDTNLIGSSSWYVMSFHSAVTISFFWWPQRKQGERPGLPLEMLPLYISNQSTQIDLRFQSRLYSLKQSMPNQDKFNRWTHRETHLITLSFHLALPATIISHYIEQFSAGNFAGCCHRASTYTIKYSAYCPLCHQFQHFCLMWTDADW